MTMYRILCGDILSFCRHYRGPLFHGVLCDPPYELAFMGKSWDRSGVAFQREMWSAISSLLYPGAMLLAFGGSRTSHRLACAIEDAGFEIRDTILWAYGSGFPKSHDVSKAIDADAGAEREVIGPYQYDSRRREGSGPMNGDSTYGQYGRAPIGETAPATPASAQWSGYGTALKPSFEPILVCQKQLTHVPIDDKIMADTQDSIGGLLCQLLSNVNNAEKISRLSRQDLSGARVSALMIAAVIHGAESGELFEATDMFSSRETVSMCLNIALLWNSILEELYTNGSMFTTSTVINLTTELRTLNYLLSEIIPEGIIRGVSSLLGSPSNVTDAERNLSGDFANTKNIPTAFAAALASLPRDENFTNARNADRDLLPTIRAVVSVLNHALQSLTTESAERISPNLDKIILARKPFERGATVAETALKYGTGTLNIDGCRIGTEERFNPPTRKGSTAALGSFEMCNGNGSTVSGRWPANLLHDGSAEVTAMFPETISGNFSGNRNHPKTRNTFGDFALQNESPHMGDSGSAARFFKSCPPDDEVIRRLVYRAKASRKERDAGLAGFPIQAGTIGRKRCAKCGRQAVNISGTCTCENPIWINGDDVLKARNTHATVKPISLTRYLARLICPPPLSEPRRILVPFAGVGSEMIGAMLAGWDEVIGVELDSDHEYIPIAKARLAWWADAMRWGHTEIDAILDSFQDDDEDSDEGDGDKWVQASMFD